MCDDPVVPVDDREPTTARAVQLVVRTAADAFAMLALVDRMIVDRVDPLAREHLHRVQAWLISPPLDAVLAPFCPDEDPLILGEYPPGVAAA